MKQITFYLDFTSPYAYLAFHALPQSLLGLSYSVVYVPVCLTAAPAQEPPLYAPNVPDAPDGSNALGEAQRVWQQRHLRWLARRQGLALEMPPQKAWSACALARLALACDAQCQPNRFVCETVFEHVWCSAGAESEAPQPNVQHASPSASSSTSSSLAFSVASTASLSAAQNALHSGAGLLAGQGAGLDAPHWAALVAQLEPLRVCSDAAVQQAWQTQHEQATNSGVFAQPSWVVDAVVFSGFEALPMLRDSLERGLLV
jgi:2-hydroxychromene-2-carboxylate isomerase